MRKTLYPLGQRFGRLIIIAEGVPLIRNGYPDNTSVCRCDCGTIKTIRNRALGKGGTISCGCFRETNPIKHGHNLGRNPSGTYQSWIALRQRCNDPNAIQYKKNYGGVGIRVCSGLDDFTLFLRLLGERPKGLSIDRWPDKYGNYSCGQCAECLTNGWMFNLRWATQKQQMRNMTKNRIVTVRGVTGCVAEVCEHFGVNEALVGHRLGKGWKIEDAFFRSKRARL